MAEGILGAIPKYNIGDKVWVWINWIGYQKGTIVKRENISKVYGYLYDVEIDEGQETSKKYSYDRSDLDIQKARE